jgi:cadmium resistance protein CadD (predicted permease)
MTDADVRDGTPETEVEMLVASIGWWLGSIVFFLIWVAIAFWPARVAARKGHSFLGYFLFSLIFFPAALIVAYMVQDRRAVA